MEGLTIGVEDEAVLAAVAELVLLAAGATAGAAKACPESMAAATMERVRVCRVFMRLFSSWMPHRECHAGGVA